MSCTAPDFQSFGAALKWWRLKRELHQDRLAEMVGTHQGTISRLENDGLGVSVGLLMRIAAALDLAPADVAEFARLAAERTERPDVAA